MRNLEIVTQNNSKSINTQAQMYYNSSQRWSECDAYIATHCDILHRHCQYSLVTNSTTTPTFIPAERFAVLQSFSQENADTLQKTIDIKTIHLEWTWVFPEFKAGTYRSEDVQLYFFRKKKAIFKYESTHASTPFVYKHESSKY